MLCKISNEGDSWNPEVTKLLSYHILSTNTYAYINYSSKALVASSPLCDSVLVEIKCKNVRRNTTVCSVKNHRVP
jgi:hypothetical protein